jgi:group I intron endonuclease
MKVIYCIQNKVNNKRYIGSSKDWYVRKRMHLNQLTRQIHHSIKLQRAWNKYGADKFSFVVLEEVAEESHLIPREQWWIDNTNCEYNICKVAGNTLGRKPNRLSRQRMSLAHLGEKHPEWRNAIKSVSQGGENHWTQKKSFSKKSRKKMSDSQKKLFASGYQHPNKRKIIQLNLELKPITTWDSINQAASALNIKRGGISNCLNGKSKSSAGFCWKFA